MSIWKKAVSVEKINSFTQGCVISHLGIKFTDISEDSLTATMPVNECTRQPLGFLHGGASVVLSETLGSVASHLCVDENKLCLGIEVNANHLKSVKEGVVVGVATPLRLGRSIQVWDIRISSEDGQLICVSRLSVAIRDAQ